MNVRWFVTCLLIWGIIFYSNLFSAENRLTYLGVGARAVALNGAFTSIADDYSATFWNPAGISMVPGFRIGGMHSKMALNRSQSFASIIIPLSYHSRIAFSWAIFSINNIEGRTTNTATPDFMFSSHERMAWFTYSRRIFKKFSAGINLKFLESQLSSTRAIGGGMDFGLYLNLFSGFNLSYVSQDIATHLKWNTDYIEKCNRIERYGLSFNVLQSLLITSDFIKKNNEDLFVFGAEVKMWGSIRLRSGLGQDCWSFGSGIILPLNSKNILVANYTFKNDLFYLDPIHIFDINLQLF